MAKAFSEIDRLGGLRESVYRAIRRQISTGRLAPGAHLTEAFLAEALSVSRTPVREGLSALAREGLLVREGRSYVVPTLTLEDIQEVYEMRCLLEPEAIRQVCALLNASDLDDLRAAVIAHRTADHEKDADAFRAANRRFREGLFNRVRNSRLRKSIALYNDHMDFARVTLDDPMGRQVVLQNLDALMAVLGKRNSDAAAKIWERHVTASHEWVREWVRVQSAFEEEPVSLSGSARSNRGQ
jgi:DNA-binding GntR family transcriptional regulator